MELFSLTRLNYNFKKSSLKSGFSPQYESDTKQGAGKMFKELRGIQLCYTYEK